MIMVKNVSYFVIVVEVHYNIKFTGSGVSSGIILQRFPEKDWPDSPFIEGIEWVQKNNTINFHFELQLI